MQNEHLTSRYFIQESINFFSPDKFLNFEDLTYNDNTYVAVAMNKIDDLYTIKLEKSSYNPTKTISMNCIASADINIVENELLFKQISFKTVYHTKGIIETVETENNRMYLLDKGIPLRYLDSDKFERWNKDTNGLDTIIKTEEDEKILFEIYENILPTINRGYKHLKTLRGITT